MLKLENLRPNKGSNKTNSRVGRGQGSGGGGTAKRGHKGAKSRSGYSRKLGFEGGQMPLQRRLPKFGFKNPNRVEYKAVNLDTLQYIVDGSGLKSIDLGVLYNLGITSKKDLVKILGRGELTSSVEVKVNAFSKSAIKAIEKAGGTAIVEATFDPSASEGVEMKKEAAQELVAPVEKVAKTKAPVVEEKAEEEKPKVKKATKSVKGDDLKKIEGIGPKIAELFNQAGIVTFDDLSKAEIGKLESILSEAGARYASHNPSTWPEQAGLAASGKWDELKELQDRLDGGRPD